MTQEKQLSIKYNSQSLIGTKQNHNQDAFAEFPLLNGYGFAICDGINGKEGGAALAAKMAIESIKKQFRNNQFKNPQKALTNALTLANFQLFDHAQKNERFKGFGSSCGIVLIIDNLIYYAYIGNIRFYILRDNTIYRLTKDHTKAQQDNATSVQQNNKDYYKVTRALGFEKDVNFSVCKQPIAADKDDMLLLTSDGLYKELSEEQIAEIMNNPDASVEFIATNLARKADEAGGSDNITVTCVQFQAKGQKQVQPAPPKNTPSGKKIPKGVWIAIGIIALIAILFGINEMVFKNEQVTQIAQPAAKKTDTIKPEKPRPVKPDTTAPVIKANYITYKIEQGDNFYRLGIRFNVTVQRLENDNNIKSERLRLGQKIRIPVKAVHTINTGESLSTIAEKYHTPVNHILKANKLTNADRIKEGMSVYIPFQYDDKIK